MLWSAWSRSSFSHLFRVQGSGFRVQCLGFGVQSSGFRVQGSGCRVPVHVLERDVLRDVIHQQRPHRTTVVPAPSFQNELRGTSFTSNTPLLGSYSRTTPRVLWWSLGEGCFW